MSNGLEILWETHEFAIEKIAKLEDEFNLLLLELNNFLSEDMKNAFDNLQSSTKDLSFAMNLPPEEDCVSKNVLIKNFAKVTSELNVYYNKQITTIEELECFYENNKYSIPEDREVAIGSFKELREITLHLRDVLNASHKDVINILDEI
jgi:hypothetical protein